MQDISLFWYEQKVSRTSVLTPINIAEMKAADRVLVPLGRRLSILSRYVGAVLTASLSPAAPILSIENAQRAGLGAFTYAWACGFLSSATSRLRRDRSLPICPPVAESEGKRKIAMSGFNL